VADEAKKPKNDQDDDYGPEHGYAFPLGWFKRHIPTEFHEAIKQKIDPSKRRPAAVWVADALSARPLEHIDTLSSFRTKQLL
jgi:hypothetical protein